MQILPADLPAEETTLSESDSNYFGFHFDTPSGMTFYEFNKLSVRPFQVKEIIKLGAAKKSGKIQYVIEAIAASIDRPVYALTVADFYALCYWERIQSYQTRPFTVFWQCDNPEHVASVVSDPTSVAPDTLNNQTVLHRSDLRITPLDTEALKPIAEKLSALGIALYMPSVADLVETLETASKWDDTAAFLAPLAACLHVHHGKKLADRIRFLNDLPNETGGLILELLDEAKVVIDKAGVVEAVKAQCSHCNEVQEVVLSTDLLSFFPIRG